MERNIKLFSKLALILALILSLTTLMTSCSSGRNNAAKTSTVSISVTGVEITGTLTLKVINESTGESEQIKLRRGADYITELQMAPGTYTIEKILPSDKSYEIKSLNESFVVSSTRENITLEMTETNVSGTLAWFLSNNAFLLLALAGSLIAYGVIIARKKKLLAQQSGNQ